MGDFANSFVMMLVHSLWQAGLLALVYLAVGRLPLPPLMKRNILLTLLFSQLLLSVFTFCFYYNDLGSTGTALSGIIPAGSLLDYPYAYTASNIFLLIYCAVVIFRATSHIRQWLGFRDKCDAFRVKPSATIRTFTETTAASFGIAGKVRIWYHTDISGPLTYGLLKPVILLPVALVNNLSPREVESLIIHELTHIRYNDYAFNFLVIFMETIFFFNPFIRTIINDIRLEREKNCDQHVINFRYDPVEYAETLLKALKMKPAVAGFQIGAVHRKYHLMKRIKFFTAGREAMGCRRILALSYVAIILFFCINLFTLSGLKGSRIFEATAFTPGLTPRIMIGDHTGEPVPSRESESIAQTEKSSPQKVYLPDNQTLEEVTVVATIPEPTAYPIIPVNFEQPEIKEMVVSDTDPLTGNKVTTVFRVITVNGEVHSEPILTIVEGKLKADTLPVAKDSMRMFNIEQ